MSGAPPALSRRAFMRGCSAAALAVPLATLGRQAAVAAPPGLPGVAVRPRSDWAAGLPVPETLPQEAPGDVRVLIVHHSASTNGYTAGDVAGVLRGFHSFHTGREKGWPDVAYNFFVDRYGTVWEGRAGSLAGPVMPSATGGSQGFSQICCFIGDHTAEAPTAEAQQSMTLLLAGLAERYGIDPSPGATTAFTSRGSNKWPAGESITTATIAGHRDMSLTSCPGDAAYPLVTDGFPAAVTAVLAARTSPPPQRRPKNGSRSQHPESPDSPGRFTAPRPVPRSRKIGLACDAPVSERQGGLVGRLRMREVQSHEDLLRELRELRPVSHLVLDLEPLLVPWDEDITQAEPLIQSLADAASASRVTVLSNSRRPPHYFDLSNVRFVPRCRKPHRPKLLAPFGCGTVVVGDAILTDGLLACREGALFLH